MKLIPALMVKVINVVNTEIIANVLMSHSNSACEVCSSACSENNLNCFKASFNIDVVSYLRLIVARVKLAPMSWVFTCNFVSAVYGCLLVSFFFLLFLSTMFAFRVTKSKPSWKSLKTEKSPSVIIKTASAQEKYSSENSERLVSFHSRGIKVFTFEIITITEKLDIWIAKPKYWFKNTTKNALTAFRPGSPVLAVLSLAVKKQK